MTETTEAREIRVLLADDHPLVRRGIRNTLALAEDVKVVGEAVDGEQVQRMSCELRPDVLLVDRNMPGPSPFETAAYLQENCPEVKVLALTAYDDDVYVRGWRPVAWRATCSRMRPRRRWCARFGRSYVRYVLHRLRHVQHAPL